MAKLIYSAITSLDGYIEDADGKFDWAAPDEEVHAFVNDLERSIAVYVYGRRTYDTMVFWETADAHNEPEIFGEYALMWRTAEKVVCSRTLEAAASERTRIERALTPDSLRELKSASTADMSIGGPELASQAFAAGLVDECRLFLNPIVVGGGKRALPDHVRADLELLEERRFTSGVVYVRYRVAT